MDMPLLERDAEIAAIEQLVGIGGFLVLEGPAGRAARPPRSGK
jgi:hypothetical protein